MQKSDNTETARTTPEHLTWLDAPAWVSWAGFGTAMLLLAAACLGHYSGHNKLSTVLLACAPLVMGGADAAWAALKNRQSKAALTAG